MSPQPAPSKNHTRSTGPRTAAGKAASSRNAIRHGLASGTLLMPGEDAAEWRSLLSGLTDEWNPATATEQLLVHSMARHHWLVERALRLQSEALAAAAPGMLPPTFALLLRYQTTNERAFWRAHKALEEMQRNRRQFVSQNESRTANRRSAEQVARLTVPLPPPDYEKIIERIRAAKQSGHSKTEAAPAG